MRALIVTQSSGPFSSATQY